MEQRFNFVNHIQAAWQGIFNFGRAGTQGPDPRVPSGTGGVGFASFLLGFGNRGNVVNGTRPASANRYTGAYFQDDFRTTRRLTLNLGLRWDIETGSTERYDRLSAFDPTIRSPLSERVGMDLYGGYLFPGNGLDRRSVRDTSWGNIAPRIGIAYELTSKAAIRAGYGMFSAVPAYSGQFVGPMFNASTPWVTSLDSVTPYCSMSDPFPEGLNPQEGSANGLLAAMAQGVTAAWPETMKAPYNQQLNFTIQQGVANNLVFEIAYAGNKGIRLPLDWNLNQLRPELLCPENDLLSLVPNPFHGLIPTGTLAAPMVQRGQLLRSFPQYTGVTVSRASWGNSNYHTLQMKLERRYSAGLTAMAAYNYSKLISDGGENVWASAGPRNAYGRACDRSISIYDQTHRLVSNFTWELPVGRGKGLGSKWNKVMDAVLGHWQVSGIVTIGSARPLQFGVVQNTSFSFGGGQRPDNVGRSGDLGSERSIARWFDTTAFVLPQPLHFRQHGTSAPERSQGACGEHRLLLFQELPYPGARSAPVRWGSVRCLQPSGVRRPEHHCGRHQLRTCDQPGECAPAGSACFKAGALNFLRAGEVDGSLPSTSHLADITQSSRRKRKR